MDTIENVKLVSCDMLSKATPVIMDHSGLPGKPQKGYYDYFVIIYAAYGSGLLTYSHDKTLQINKHDILFIKPNFIHSLHYIGKFMELYYCKVLPHIKGSIIRNFPKGKMYFDDMDFMIVHDLPSLSIRNIFVTMIGEYMSNSAGHTELLNAYLIILLFNIFRLDKSESSLLKTSDNKWVGATVQYIYLHIYDKISISELAKIHNITPEHLCRTFKKHMSMTISQFITQTRINKLKDILKNTNRSIRSANELFDLDSAYLQKCFKKEVGMSMTDYWNKYHK